MSKRYCFIPECNTRCTSERKKRQKDQNYRKISLFGVPKNDEALLKKWQRKIPRDGFTVKDRVCEIHFKQDEIVRFWETKLTDGTIHRLERSLPRLKPGAVPSIFPNLPKYLSYDVKQRKPPMDRSKIQPQKRKKRSHLSELSCEAPVASDNDSNFVPNDLNFVDVEEEEYTFAKLLEDIDIIMINWSQWIWNRISIKGEDVVFMTHIDETEKLPDKFIRIENNLDILGFFYGNKKVQLPSNKISNPNDLYSALEFMSEVERRPSLG